jgi:PAS domain S-box-containing protein
MPIGIADTSGRIDYINPRFRETFGYSLGEIDGLDQWFTKAYPDAAYREAMRDQWTEVLKEAAREQRPSAVMDVHVTCRDGSVRIMEVFGAVVGGRVIAVFNDLTERVRSEAALRESVAEKESLLREVHHRVKNNLQIINSLLQLQARKVQNEDVHALFRDTQNRVRSMALLHETLYRSGNVARVSLLQYVREVCRHIARSYGTVPGLIELRQEVADVMLDLDLAIPAGLIVSELVTNAFKHAFPFRSEGEIIVAVQNVDEKHLALRVSDNGVGLRADADPEDAETLGLLLVRSLTRQLDGQMTIYRENGTLFEIVFPVPGS